MPRSSTAISGRRCIAPTTAARNFAEIGSPAFPADAAGAPSVFQYWTLETGGPHHPDRLWMGAIPAGLFRSEDRGATWQLVDSLWNVPGARQMVRRRL